MSKFKLYHRNQTLAFYKFDESVNGLKLPDNALEIDKSKKSRWIILGKYVELSMPFNEELLFKLFLQEIEREYANIPECFFECISDEE